MNTDCRWSVRDPAGLAFFSMQPVFEKQVAGLYAKHPKGAAAQTQAERLVTQYTNAATTAVENGYWNLVDCLQFRYHYKGDLGTLNQCRRLSTPRRPTRC